MLAFDFTPGCLAMPRLRAMGGGNIMKSNAPALGR
jgi:hypothetical protein